MFGWASSFSQGISVWDVSSMTNAYGIFFGAESFNASWCTWADKLVGNAANTSVMLDGSGCANNSAWCQPYDEEE